MVAIFFFLEFLAMFILYTVAPILYRMASSPYYNLSLLSSDFFGLLFGKLSLSYSLYLYFVLICDHLRAFLICKFGLQPVTCQELPWRYWHWLKNSHPRRITPHTGCTSQHSPLSYSVRSFDSLVLPSFLQLTLQFPSRPRHILLEC